VVFPAFILEANYRENKAIANVRERAEFPHGIEGLGLRGAGYPHPLFKEIAPFSENRGWLSLWAKLAKIAKIRRKLSGCR
jgi:hypothetical protein